MAIDSNCPHTMASIPCAYCDNQALTYSGPRRWSVGRPWGKDGCAKHRIPWIFGYEECPACRAAELEQGRPVFDAAMAVPRADWVRIINALELEHPTQSALMVRLSVVCRAAEEVER